jgi:hypothetical protein
MVLLEGFGKLKIFSAETAIAKLEMYKSPSTEHFPSELV